LVFFYFRFSKGEKLGGISKQESLSPEDAKRILDAFHNDPSLQKLWQHIKKAPPPWPKVRNVSQEGP
jgi:hypothetical protein